MIHKLFDTFGIVILGLMGVTAGAANGQTTSGAGNVRIGDRLA